MTTKYGILFALVLGIVAVLYQVEVVTTRWQAEDHAVVSSSADKVWKFLTNADSVDKWFTMISHFRPVDSQPLVRGKSFEAAFKLPFIGEYSMPLRVVQIVPGRRLVLESPSLLKPKFTMRVDPTSDHSKITLKVEYQRSSALFRVFAAPLLWFLSSQRLRQALFLIKMMV